jgi:hypothetical protein
MRMTCIILITTLLATGCDSATSVPAAKTDVPAAAVTKDPGPGTPYGKLRSRLLLDGWLPLQNAQCDTDAGQSRMCRQWLELQKCSSDGHCTMAWVDAAGAQIMKIDVSGMPVQNDPGDPASSAKVDQIEQAAVAPNASDAAATRCPSTNFEQFLPAFAGEKSVRHAFAAPLVRSGVLVSDADGDRVVTVFVRDDGANVFNVNYSGGAFHHIGVDGVDPAALKLDVKADGIDTRDVSYIYGSSEGRGFRFTRQQGCWYLTGNPQPTGP